MLPTRWDPFRELSSWHREIDDLFRRTFGRSRGEPSLEGSMALTPVVNAFRKGETYHVQAELPGVDKKDIDVSVEGNLLTIRGERKMSKETKEEDFYLRESQFGSFVRRLTLPEGADTEKIHARYEDGVLQITMPLETEIPAGRKIMVEGPEKGGEKKAVH